MHPLRLQRAGIEEVITVASDSNASSIESVVNYLNSKVELSCKAVVYQKAKDDAHVVVFTSGDMDINEIKLAKHIGEEYIQL